MLTVTPPVTPSCPRCSAPNARWLEFTSLTHTTNTFQCVACGHVWTEPPTPITLERRRPRRTPARPLVLIVDGHDDTRELYAVALASLGFQTITVEDGAQAFGRVWETHPDIVVTEIALPQHDGFRLLKDLKRDARTRDIPVIILTSRSESGFRERAAQEGCATVLVKPCLPEELAQALRDVLGQAPRA